MIPPDIERGIAVPDVDTMGAHCFECKTRFRIPCITKVMNRCPSCGSTQVIDHNLEPISPEENAAVVKVFKSIRNRRYN